MSDIEREEKLPWRLVPAAIRQHVEEILGSSVARGTRVWGGYGPTPTYRLVLADGKRAFFKGTNQDCTEFARAAIEREERVYRELSQWISPWSPRFYDTFHYEDWHILLLDDVGPKSVPPWTPQKGREVTTSIAAFHQSTLGQQLPAWLPQPTEFLSDVSWDLVAEGSEQFSAVARLANAASNDALLWLRVAAPLLSRVTSSLVTSAGPCALLHGDIRSDNLRLVQGGACLFDWPEARVGPHEFDLTEFAQSVTVESGIEPEQVIAWYSERQAVDA